MTIFNFIQFRVRVIHMLTIKQFKKSTFLNITGTCKYQQLEF